MVKRQKAWFFTENGIFDLFVVIFWLKLPFTPPPLKKSEICQKSSQNDWTFDLWTVPNYVWAIKRE